MKALLNCCQRSNAVQPHSLLPPTAATADTPPALLQEEVQADARATASAPLQQQDEVVHRLSSKGDAAAAATPRSEARGGGAAGEADTGAKAAAGEACVTVVAVSAEAPAEAAAGPANLAGLPLPTDALSHAAEKTKAAAAAGDTTTAVVEAKTGGGEGGGGTAAAGGKEGATLGGTAAAAEAGAPEAEGEKKEREEVPAGEGPAQEKKQDKSEATAAASEEGGTPTAGGAEAQEKRRTEAAGGNAAAAAGAAAAGLPGAEGEGAASSGAQKGEEGEGGDKRGETRADGEGAAARECDAAHAVEGGGEGGVQVLLRPRQSATLEEMLEKKWQHLQHYMEEEQLFKAYQYLVLLEQQVEHRLALVTQALRSGGSPPSNGSSGEHLHAGGGGATAGRGGGAAGGERNSSRRVSLQQQRQQQRGRDSAGARAADAASSAGETGKNRGGEEERMPSGAQQSRLKAQEQALCEFQKRLVSEQQLKNLRTQMAIFHQMLLEFHLDHLLQACEESRLSCCESLVSTTDESDQLPQQDQAEDSAHHGGADGDVSSREGGGARAAAACGGGGAAAEEGSAAGGGGAAGAAGRGGRGGNPLLQHRGSGGSSSWSQSKGGAGSSAGATDGSAAAQPGGAWGGSAAAEHQEEVPALGAVAALLSERRLSSSKTFRQGLRSVVGRKMSFGRRSGNLSRRSVAKKATVVRRKQDDEGWLRERGHCLDLAYRVEKDSSVSMKVRGKLPCMLFQVLAILNETDLAGSWAPFFKSAEKEYQYTKASQLVRQVYDYPLLGNKETLMFCAGVNALEEGGCVCIFCRSPPENATEFMGLPVPPPGGNDGNSSSKGGSRGSWVGGGGGSKTPRIQSADLIFLLFPISEGRQTTLELFGNFHHGLRFVPMRLITFVVKKIVRSMFVSIAKQCQNFQTSLYKERVERDSVFYCWMQQKIDEYVQQKRKLGTKAGFLGGTDSAGSLASFNYEEFQD